MLTLNQIISQITTLAGAHSQIASSGVGDFAEWQAEERTYPILWVFHEDSVIQDRYLTHNIRLICADLVISGEEGEDTDGHEQEVLSDTQLILLDFLAYFNNQYSQTYDIVRSATIEPFTESYRDRVAGNSVVIQIRQTFEWDKCSIPQSGAVIPPTVDGLTLYDFSDPTVFARLTNDQLTDLEALICNVSPVTVTVNGDSLGATGSVACGGSLDIDVTQSGSPVGSWNGSEWVIPAATSPSISLAVSDATPSYGDTITFTATATGFSPTSYTFIIPQWGGGFIEVTQAGNTYNWTVDAVGNRTASVIGVNGSTSAASSSVSLTIPCYPLDHISSNPDWACAFRPLSVRQSGDVITVRRSSDNATSSYTATEYAGSDPLTFVGAGTGYMSALIDQSDNNRDVFQTTAAYQGVIVESSARVVDSDGYSAWRNQSGTQAMRTRSSLCGTNGALFIVCEIDNLTSGSQAWLFTNGGNPAVGTFSNNPADASSPTTNSGTPSYYVNGVAVTNTRGALGTALIGNRCVVAITGIDFNQTVNWRSTDTAVIGLYCNTASKFLAFVAFNDFDNTERATFENELMTYYGI